jgi:hypothetical protein
MSTFIFRWLKSVLLSRHALYSYPFICLCYIWFLSGSCKGGEKTYKYRLARMDGLEDGRTVEIYSILYVCFQGKLFEYETIQKTSSKIDRTGTEFYRKTAYDTTGLYLIQPDLGRYVRLQYQNGKYEFSDTGRLHNKKQGLHFDYARLRKSVEIEASRLRDTSIDGERLRLYEKVIPGIDSGTPIKTRYYFSKREDLKSVLTLGNAERFIGVGEIYRFEFIKDSMNLIMSVKDLDELSSSEKRTFKKIMSDLRGTL